MNYSYLFCVIVLFTSCSSPSTADKIYTFPQNHELNGTEIILEHPHRIGGLAISDSILFILNYSAYHAPAVAAYKLSSMEYIGSFAYTGKGKGELLTPYNMCVDEEFHHLWIYDNNKKMLGGYTIKPFSLERNQVFNNQISLPFQNIEIVHNINVSSKNIYALFRPSKQGGIFQLYENNVCKKSIGNLDTNLLDIDTAQISPLVFKQLFMARSEFNFTKNKMAVFYMFTDIVQIADMNLEIIKTLQGPDFFKPNHLVNGMFARTKDTKTAYVQTASDDQFIYASFYGKEDTDPRQGTRFLHVFDWDGSPVCRYKMTPPCTFMALDSRNKKIYAASEDSDNLLVYDLKHLQ